VSQSDCGRTINNLPLPLAAMICVRVIWSWCLFGLVLKSDSKKFPAYFICVRMARTVYLHCIWPYIVISLPNIPYTHRTHKVLANPTYAATHHTDWPSCYHKSGKLCACVFRKKLQRSVFVKILHHTAITVCTLHSFGQRMCLPHALAAFFSTCNTVSTDGSFAIPRRSSSCSSDGDSFGMGACVRWSRSSNGYGMKGSGMLAEGSLVLPSSFWNSRVWW